MTPEISEFSYGFALTNELVGWTELHAAPIFPNLIEEGRQGGGYDVRLDMPAAPLYLQFKRSDYMSRGTAREIKRGAALAVPFHRFAITERKRSLQHTSLVSLDDGHNLVFYAAPRFHTLAGINSAWAAQRVIERSVFVAPSQIGLIGDDDPHTVAFDQNAAFFCSKPRIIRVDSIIELRARLMERFAEDPRPLRSQLSEWEERVSAARRRAQSAQVEIESALEQGRELSTEGFRGIALPADSVRFKRVPIRQRPLPPPRVEIRSEKELTLERAQLRAISDEARRSFNAQLIVVQPKL